MKTPKVIPPLGPSKMSILRLGTVMTMDERFEIIGKLFDGYIGDFIRMLEAVENCRTLSEVRPIVDNIMTDRWLDELPTVEMLETKLKIVFEA